MDTVQIIAPENASAIDWQGVIYEIGPDGTVEVPMDCAKEMVASHGFTLPAAQPDHLASGSGDPAPGDQPPPPPPPGPSAEGEAAPGASTGAADSDEGEGQGDADEPIKAPIKAPGSSGK